MTYTDDFLQQLRDANSMEQVASGYVNLTKRGRNFVCNCPFHSEKTPSCTIFTDTQSFYCFGCGAGGDVFTWLKLSENVEFPEAVKILAERAGMEIPDDREAVAFSQRKTRLLKINRETANFYYRYLLKGDDKRGLMYFAERKLKPETVKKYGLGYAPDRWGDLSDFLLKKGFTEEELILANVSHRSKNSGKLYDAFRGRVMFPIVDVKGNVIGFGGRVLDNSQPKYLNTAATPVFDKGKNLFSLNFAKDSDSTRMILAEGYMDVIAVNQAGFSNVVATLGTAITPDQANKLSRYCKEIIIAYDSDGAGQNATQKAINHFSAVGLPTRILHMEGAKDPDEYIKKFGSERFRMLLDGAGDAINFRLDRCAMGLNLDTESGKVQFLKRAVQVLAGIQNAIERDVYISRTSDKFQVSRDVLQAQIAQLNRSKIRVEKKREWDTVMQHTIQHNPKNPVLGENQREIKAEERIICFLLRDDTNQKILTAGLTVEDFVTDTGKKIFQVFLENRGASLSLLSSVLEVNEMSQVSRILATNSEITISEAEVLDCIKILKDGRQAEPETDEDLLALVQRKKQK